MAIATRLAKILVAQLSPVTFSDNLRKKALDREVPYNAIPKKDLALHEEAKHTEWRAWQDLECVKVVPLVKLAVFCKGLRGRNLSDFISFTGARMRLFGRTSPRFRHERQPVCVLKPAGSR